MVRSRSWAAVIAVIVLAGCGKRDAEPGAGDWEFKAGRTSWLRVVGQEGPEGKPRTKPVILSFDCLPDNAASTIMTDQSLRQGTAEARVTVDRNPPLTLPAFAGTTASGGQVVLTISQDSLLGLLGGHQRAVIEYADGAGSSRTTAEFPVAGVETYRDRFLAACAERDGQAQ